MSVASALAAGRAARVQLMRDTVTITRSTQGAWSSATGEYGPPTVTTVYSGMADVRTPTLSPQQAQAGERAVTVTRYDVALPWSSTAEVRIGDMVTVTASDDAGLVGRGLVVTAVERGPRRTAHHLSVEEAS